MKASEAEEEIEQAKKAKCSWWNNKKCRNF